MRIARLFVLCFSLLGLPVFAATVPNLYQVHEPVSSQQPGERDAGLVRALQTLLVRLTGNPQAPQNPALAGYLKDPQQLISHALLAVDAKEADGKWQAQWRLWMGDSREQGQAEGATPDALADSVMLAVGNRLSTRFVATPEAATGLTLQVQGATLARYAELQRLLDPFGARLVGVRGDRLDYSVKASPEQLRAQLGLAQLQEIPADSVPLDASGQPAAPSAAVPSSTQLNFRWQ
uniref:DUF2066 domain-containing protein n=1 Tax=Pseudomonas aeruginosa TaxID=287 RepID=UPI0010433224|nr:DUF2066 domain-containing protein [Pseudomonas aeruginosa]